MLVNHIPEGFHTVTPYLRVKGAAKAIKFYKKTFGAKEVYSLPGPGGGIVHAEIEIGDSKLMLSDEFPDWNVLGPESLKGSTVTIHLYVDDVDALMKQAASAGATVIFPATNMFWGDRNGQLKDPFGHIWSIATHVEDLSPEEIAQRSGPAMAKMCEKK